MPPPGNDPAFDRVAFATPPGIHRSDPVPWGHLIGAFIQRTAFVVLPHVQRAAAAPTGCSVFRLEYKVEPARRLRYERRASVDGAPQATRVGVCEFCGRKESRTAFSGYYIGETNMSGLWCCGGRG